jgi:hypothetical protein
MVDGRKDSRKYAPREVLLHMQRALTGLPADKAY